MASARDSLVLDSACIRALLHIADISLATQMSRDDPTGSPAALLPALVCMAISRRTEVDSLAQAGAFHSLLRSRRQLTMRCTGTL